MTVSLFLHSWLVLLLGGAGSVPVPAGHDAAAPRVSAALPGAAVAQPDVSTALARQRAPAGGYRWPLDGAPPVLRRFEPPPEAWSPGHRGVDLGGTPGAGVRAAGAGVVVFAGRLAGRGVISVRHGNGLRTTYEPVDPVVDTGSPVAAGDVIGTLAAGHPGCPAAACLHWGLRDDSRYYDPLLLLGLGRVRLLPLDGASRDSGAPTG